MGLVVYEYYHPHHSTLAALASNVSGNASALLGSHGSHRGGFHRGGNWTDLFHVVPVICFGYQVKKTKLIFLCEMILLLVLQCHVSVIPIYSCMRRRDKLHFTVASFSAIAVCFLSYTLTGAFGLWTFGADRVESDLLMNYSAKRPEVMAAVAAMAAKTFATYPILVKKKAIFA